MPVDWRKRLANAMQSDIPALMRSQGICEPAGMASPTREPGMRTARPEGVIEKLTIILRTAQGGGGN